MHMPIRLGSMALLVGVALSAPVHAASDGAPEWALVAAPDDGVASLWLVRQVTDRPSLVTLQEHIEMDATHQRAGLGYRRFTDFDCAARTVERGGSSVYEAESEQEYGDVSVTALGIPTPPYDDGPVTPEPGSYEERVLEYACAFAAGDPAFAQVPRLDRPFYRDDVERVLAAANPDYRPRTYQGFAVPLTHSGVFGLAAAAREPSRKAAEAKLTAQCTAKGWECQSVVTHQCAAIVWNEAQLAYFVGVGPTKQQAVEQAQAYCSQAEVNCGGMQFRCP